MNTPGYFVIEGVKGSGKSTVTRMICNTLAEEGISVRLIGPTRPCAGFSLLEWVSANIPTLRNYDFWNEFLYAGRSASAASLMKCSDTIYIGDRSIVTSYVSRWDKWNDPEITVRRVNLLEPFLPAPDVIFYLSLTAEEALRRISLREKRNYGLEAQTPPRIAAALKAYEQIQNASLPRLRNTVWVRIDASASADEVAEVIAERIKHYIEYSNANERTMLDENCIYN